MRPWSEAALRVLNERYVLKNEQGEPCETAQAVCWRVAKAIAAAERTWGDEKAEDQWGMRFYELLMQREFLPNSPTLMNAGRGNGLQLSACFVLPVEDSMEGIFDAMKWAALIHKSGGGTGFAFSRLRPKGAIVGSTHGVASGPVSFMRCFDGATEAIKQGGFRRGANMGVLRVDHPDILEFIDCKRDGSVTNFNISVGITDAFMGALQEDSNYGLVDPHTRQVVRALPAKHVWQRILEAAWTTGDPGLLFLDRANRSTANPVPDLEQLEATNPCGEQFLSPFDCCNLGSINLGALMVSEFQGKRSLNWRHLETVTEVAVRFLDDVIEVNPFPLPQITEKVYANRRIGLGVMGWADLLLKLGLPYGSEEAVALGEEVMTRISDYANNASQHLAEERGSFPNFDKSIYRDGKPMRNATRTTVAPTGSISILADCSSGIEPLFALAFQHRVKQPDGSYRVLDFVNPLFRETLEKCVPFGDAHSAVLNHVSAHGTLEGIDWEHLHGWGQGSGAPMPEALQPFVTAHEIAPEWHIRMQAAFQKGVDNSISKTVNLPNSATVADVGDAYQLAWDLGCLGITVFRDGCKGEQVLNAGVQEATPGETVSVFGVKHRPVVVRGYTRQVRAPEGKVNITLNSDEDGLLEVFLTVGKAGSDIAALAEALGRLMSLNLRMGQMDQSQRVAEMARQLRGIGGSRSIGFGPQQVRSLPDAIAQALDAHLAETDSITEDLAELTDALVEHGASLPAFRQLTGNLCPDCNSMALVYEEGCKKCQNCGFSAC